MLASDDTVSDKTVDSVDKVEQEEKDVDCVVIA